MAWSCPWYRKYRPFIVKSEFPEWRPIEKTSLKKKIFIHIGDLHCSRDPAIIETVLGSCVAVCLHDPLACIGGMNHILLPGRANLEQFDTVARYGINAMELLINQMAVTGAARARLTAKVFGGAHILPSISAKNGAGLKNIEFVMDFLALESIPVVSYNVGGHSSRRIYFHTDSGDVFLKRIPSAHYPNIDNHERRLLQRVKRTVEKPGDVTLFDQ